MEYIYLFFSFDKLQAVRLHKPKKYKLLQTVKVAAIKVMTIQSSFSFYGMTQHHTTQSKLLLKLIVL